MPEDVFRIIVTAAVALAAIAFIVQAAMMTGLYRAVRKMQARTDPLAARLQALVERATPVIEKLGPAIDSTGLVIDQLGPAIDRTRLVIDQLGPVIEKAGLMVERADQAFATAQLMLDENRPDVAAITSDASQIAKAGRRQVERVSGLLDDASGRIHARLEQIDRSVDSTVEQVEQVGDAVKRAVKLPVRELNGLAAGVAAGIAALMHGRKYPVDQTTQDEEMFI